VSGGKLGWGQFIGFSLNGQITPSPWRGNDLISGFLGDAPMLAQFAALRLVLMNVLVICALITPPFQNICQEHGIKLYPLNGGKGKDLRSA
jgi:hypothetical protein